MFTWWLGQDFGGLFTGTSTDPNTALPMGVFLLAAMVAYREPAVQAAIQRAGATPAMGQGVPSGRTTRLRSAQELRAAAAINNR